MDKMKLEKYLSWIDDYFDGKLSEENMSDMETAVKTNPTLKAKLKEHIEVRSQIRRAGMISEKEYFLNKFNQPGTNLEKESSPPSKNRVWLISGLLLILAALAFWFLKPSQEISIADVFAEDPLASVTRTNSNQSNDQTLNKALEKFNEKEYAQAIQLFDQIPNNDTLAIMNAGKISLFKGVAQMRLENYQKAISTFVHIEKNNPYYDQGIWYKALSQVRANKTNDAKITLQNIIEQENHFKKEQAQHLLNQLSE